MRRATMIIASNAGFTAYVHSRWALGTPAARAR